MRIPINSDELMAVICNAFKGDGLIHSPGIDFVARRGNRKFIIVAAAPRTGSTYLTNVLARVSGYRSVRLCAAYATNENDLYLPGLYLMNQTGCVSQLHMKGTYHNASLLKTFGVSPIILVRNIYDIIVSLVDDLKNKEAFENFGTGRHGYSFIWQDQNIKSCPDQQLLDAVIDLALPWFVNFYVSWHRLCQQGMVHAKWVTYEQLMADKRQTVVDIMNFVGAPVVAPDLDEIIDYRAATFNVGGSGRGKQALSSAQQERVKRLLSYYPDIDFSYYAP